MDFQCAFHAVRRQRTIIWKYLLYLVIVACPANKTVSIVEDAVIAKSLKLLFGKFYSFPAGNGNIELQPPRRITGLRCSAIIWNNILYILAAAQAELYMIAGMEINMAVRHPKYAA